MFKLRGKSGSRVWPVDSGPRRIFSAMWSAAPAKPHPSAISGASLGPTPAAGSGPGLFDRTTGGEQKRVRSRANSPNRGVSEVQIRPSPPTSLSLIGHFRELRKIRACARDLPSHADPERGVVGANRPNFANPLCARFPYVRPHAIGGVPIRGSERSGAGLSLFLRLQRVPNPLPIWPRQSDVC